MNKFYLLSTLILLGLAACTSDQKKTAVVESVKPSEIKKEPVKVMTEATLDLTRYGMANDGANKLGGLKVGATAPDFTLYDQSGESVNLYELLGTTNVALTFYRGHWCGYCSRQMAAYMDGLEKMNKAGIQLLAISPETEDQNNKFSRKNELRFPILSDENHEASKAYMGYFKVTPAYVDKLSADFLKWNNDSEAQLNVPATYLIGKDKKIKYAFYDNDYSKRATVDDLLKAL